MKSLVVLWEHRFALTLIVLAIAFLAISAGRQLQRYGDFRTVVRYQAELNLQLVNWTAPDDPPDLLSELPAPDAKRFMSLASSGAGLLVSDPACRPHKPRSFIGSRSHPTACPHLRNAGEETNPSEFACETAVSWSSGLSKKAASSEEAACLVTVWAPNTGGYDLIKTRIFWPKHLSSEQDQQTKTYRADNAQAYAANR